MTVETPTAAGDRAGRMALARRWAARLVGAGLLAGGGYVLWRAFHQLSADEVVQAIREWGPARVGGAVAFSACSFFLSGVLEWLGLRWSGVKLPFRVALHRSTIVNGLAHSLGANLLTATVARAWAYRGERLPLLPSATVTLFAALSFATGLASLVGFNLVAATPEQLRDIGAPAFGGRALAGVLLALVLAYLAVCAFWPARRLFRNIELPPWRYALAQVGIGIVDNFVSAAILWLLIGPDAPAYPSFVAAYALSCVAGLASTVPAGLGVFEGAFVTLLPNVRPTSLAVGFIGFRLFFYLLPLLVAIVLGLLNAAKMERRRAV